MVERLHTTTLIALRVVGAALLLLLVAGCGTSAQVAVSEPAENESAGSESAALVTPQSPTPAPDAVQPGDGIAKQAVLSATVEIPAGTSVTDLLVAPNSFFTSDVLAEEALAPEAILSIAALSEFDGWVVRDAVAPGEQLVATSLVDPNTFGAAAEVQVLVVTQTIPAGTPVDALLETPTVWLSAILIPADFADGTISSIADLGELGGTVLERDVMPGDRLERDMFVDPMAFDATN